MEEGEDSDFLPTYPIDVLPIFTHEGEAYKCSARTLIHKSEVPASAMENFMLCLVWDKYRGWCHDASEVLTEYVVKL